jgi:hypothetical protein
MLVNPKKGTKEATETTTSSNKPTILHYERIGETIRFKTTNMSNHELNEVLLGIIARMNRDDREDFYGSLVEYVEMIEHPDRDPEKFLSPIASGIAQRPELAKNGRPQKRRSRT